MKVNIYLGAIMKSKIFYIAGPDGIGKTTYIQLLEKYLKSQNKEVIHIWLRSPKLLSKPLMAYCRLTKLTKYTYVDGIKIGRHDFYKSKTVSKIFPWLQFIDFKIYNYLKVKRKSNLNKIIIMDRYGLDTLVDIMVDTKRYSLYKERIGKRFIDIMPNNMNAIILDAKEDVIKRRRKDIEFDTNFNIKRTLYIELAKHLHIPIVDNSKSIKEVKKKIWRIWRLDNE